MDPVRLAWPPEREGAWGRAGVRRPRVDASRTLPGERSRRRKAGAQSRWVRPPGSLEPELERHRMG